MIRLTVILLVGALPAVAVGVPFVFDKPTDDIWQYPFASEPGNRDTAVVFSTVGNVTYNGFNDRDGIIVAAWNTAALIPSGQPLGNYQIESVSVTLTHQDCPPGECGNFIFPASWAVDLTVDEWDTFDVNNNGVRDGVEQLDSDPGRPLEMFGVGFGPTHSYATWIENSQLVVSTCQFGADICTHIPRDPFPYSFQQGTGIPLHVEDSIKGDWNPGVSFPGCNHPQSKCPFTAIPWAVGLPINYSPGTQTAAFDVVFSVNLDLEDGLVRDYFQRQLSGGRVVVAVTSLRETDVQEGGNPTFFLAEATESCGPGCPPIPGAKAPKLVVTLADPVDGDVDSDMHVALDDYAVLRSCLGGPGVTGLPVTAGCRQNFDFDHDLDVDAMDVAEFTRRFTGGS